MIYLMYVPRLCVCSSILCVLPASLGWVPVVPTAQQIMLYSTPLKDTYPMGNHVPIPLKVMICLDARIKGSSLQHAPYGLNSYTACPTPQVRDAKYGDLLGHE